MTAPPASLVDALRDHYTIERELGRGGMAAVYLAHDLHHNRPVALKVLEPGLGAGPAAERFRREIETAARLEHPHILPVLDSGQAREWFWYAMPYVEGESLRDRLARAGPLPLDEALRLTREAALALDFAHRHGVVHRDVKPENILLCDGQALVADFGIARAFEAASGDRLTLTGVTIGTPAYMSPEQAGGARELDGRSDVYSLGCVLYEMLTGEVPFTGPTPQAVITRRFVEDAPRIRAMRDTVPAAVEGIVARALARQPADRFQTAAELAGAVTAAAAALAPGPLAPPATTVVTPAARPVGRRPVVPASVALLGLGFLLGLGVLFAWLGTSGNEDAAGPKLLAVLPFENTGRPEDEYFADGITDEVRGKLAGLPGLRVIASASSSQYRRTRKAPEQIARELGVRYLLVGRVRWEKRAGGPSRVRVIPELVEVPVRGTPTTRWQEPIEAPLSDVFRVQTDVAGRVAEALDVALGSGDRARLDRRPTASLPAYDAYLKGEEISRDLASNPTPVAIRRAIPYYEQAVALDSTFVQAWARLSLAHSLIYLNGTHLPAEAEAARGAAERTLALAPESAVGHLALGNYYAYVLGEDRRAMEQFGAGLRAEPGNTDLLTHSAFVEQHLGRWESALEHFRQAQRLDPRSVSPALGLCRALLWLRRYPEALRAAEHGLALDPANLSLLENKAMVYLARGDLPGARSVLRSAPREVAPADLVAYVATYEDLVWVLDEAQQALLLQLGPEAFDNDRFIRTIVLAQTYAVRGDAARTRTYADSARAAAEAQLKETPEDAQLHVFRGLTLAYLGRCAEAIREGERGMALLPGNAWPGAYLQHQLVRIYLLCGDSERALDRLEPLLRIPYYLSPGWLQTDPTFTPLRSNPRFQRLLRAGQPSSARSPA